MYSRNLQYSEYASGSQYTKNLNILEIQDKLEGFLIYLRFWICSGKNFKINLNSNIQGKL